MHSDLIRKQYDFELEQKNAIASGANIPMVAITVVASAFSVIFLDYRYEHGALTCVFLAFALGGISAVCFSIFSIFRSFWNYEYQKLSSSLSLRQHFEELRNWHVANGRTDAEAKICAEADFSEYIDDRLIEAADWNGQNNLVRGNYLHRSAAAVALSVACFVPAALSYAYNKSTGEEKIHQVRILQPINPPPSSKDMSSAKPSTAPSQPTAAPAPAPATAPAVKPSGPPNLVFKGNSDLTKPSANTNLHRK